MLHKGATVDRCMRSGSHAVACPPCVSRTQVFLRTPFPHAVFFATAADPTAATAAAFCALIFAALPPMRSSCDARAQHGRRDPHPLLSLPLRVHCCYNRRICFRFRWVARIGWPGSSCTRSGPSTLIASAAENALHGCIRRSLEVALDAGLGSIAFPLVHASSKQFPIEHTAQVCARALRRFLERYRRETMQPVVLCFQHGTPEASASAARLVCCLSCIFLFCLCCCCSSGSATVFAFSPSILPLALRSASEALQLRFRSRASTTKQE